MPFLKRLFQRTPSRGDAAGLLIAKMRELQPDQSSTMTTPMA